MPGKTSLVHNDALAFEHKQATGQMSLVHSHVLAFEKKETPQIMPAMPSLNIQEKPFKIASAHMQMPGKTSLVHNHALAFEHKQAPGQMSVVHSHTLAFEQKKMPPITPAMPSLNIQSSPFSLCTAPPSVAASPMKRASAMQTMAEHARTTIALLRLNMDLAIMIILCRSQAHAASNRIKSRLCVQHKLVPKQKMENGSEFIPGMAK